MWKEFRALVVDPENVDFDFVSFPYPIGSASMVASFVLHSPLYVANLCVVHFEAINSPSLFVLYAGAIWAVTAMK